VFPHPFAEPITTESALITEFDYGPIFYGEGQGDKAIDAARADVANALALLNEARCLFSLLGMHAADRQSWVQPTDWLMSAVSISAEI
jgi:hypothetical protein